MARITTRLLAQELLGAVTPPVADDAEQPRSEGETGSTGLLEADTCSHASLRTALTGPCDAIRVT